MELEELKTAWVQMSKDLEHQKKLTNDIILDMTKEKYRNKFKAVTTYETIGALFCFGIALVFLVNFGELNTWYLKVCGILSISYLVALPILVLNALKNIKRVNVSSGFYKDNLAHYIKAKNHFLRLQQMGMGIGVAGIVFILPTFSKISANKDIFLVGLKTNQWIFLSIVLTATVFFCIWGYKGYVRLTKSAQELLNELELE